MINGKILVHFRGPVETSSGYGSHSREILDYLLTDDRFIIALEACNWGNTSHVHEFNLRDKEKLQRYYQCRSNWEQLKEKAPFDLSIQVTIPNEYKKVAQLNIGVNAGIETTMVSREWIQKCNEMDMIVVPSQHSAKVLAGTVYQFKDQNSGEIREERLMKPLFIIPEFFDKPAEIKPLDIQFETKQNLLFVGLWGGKGGFWEDRKNVSALVKLFYEIFKENARVGLVLKTQLVNGSTQDRMETERRLKEIKDNFKGAQCKVYLLHEDLTEDEMWGLYSHPQIIGMVSLTAGEGLGRPMLEAASCGKPILATNWSGHLDFLKEKEGFVPFTYDLVKIPECQVWPGVLEKDSKWAKVDEDQVKKRLRKFVDSPGIIRKQAEAHVEWLEKNFSKDAAYKRWREFFDSFIKSEEQNDGAIPTSSPQVQSAKQEAIKKIKESVVESNKTKVLYIIPQSAGDCLISTAIVNSLIVCRHWEADHDFYIATKPEFASIFDKIVEDYGVRVLPFKEEMMHAELTREVFDVVYNPGVNIQYTFSNWLLGNGEYSLRLMEEFAKQCNLTPQEMTDYNVKLEPCDIPERAYVVIAPGGIKPAKIYKYWPDVASNLREMFPDIDVVQVGALNEQMIPGALDYRGRTYGESFYVIKNACAVLSVDTFGAHIAGAMGIPHLVIYGSTHSTTCCPVMLKKTAPQLTIENNECKNKCYKNQCDNPIDGKNCVSRIEPKSICLAFQDLFERIEKNRLEEEKNGAQENKKEE